MTPSPGSTFPTGVLLHPTAAWEQRAVSWGLYTGELGQLEVDSGRLKGNFYSEFKYSV